LSGIIVAESVRQQGAGENCTTRSFVLCFLTKYYSSYKIQEYEVGGAGLVALRRFGDEDCERGDHLEGFGLHLSQILKN